MIIDSGKCRKFDKGLRVFVGKLLEIRSNENNDGKSLVGLYNGNLLKSRRLMNVKNVFFKQNKIVV